MIFGQKDKLNMEQNYMLCPLYSIISLAQRGLKYNWMNTSANSLYNSTSISHKASTCPVSSPII